LYCVTLDDQVEEDRGMEKIDLLKAYGPAFRAKAEPALADLPPLIYLMIDGHGDPNTAPEYKAAVESLYGLAYGLKFAVKKGPLAVDYGVLPLEGLWWTDVAAPTAADLGDKSGWHWTMMIAQPEYVTPDLFAAVRAEVRKKKPGLPLDRVRLEPLAEGRIAQILHNGPYSAEWPTIERLHAYIAAQGCRIAGKHHEIYLNDPNRSAPEKLQTIIRYPVT
jgi:hypothetical protein